MQELSEGGVPTNKNMVESLREVEKSLCQQAADRKGVESRFAYEAQRFVRHAREIMEEKNNDDTLRLMLEHIKEASELLAKSVPLDRLQAHGEAMMNQNSNQLQSLVESFRSLMISLARNANVRVGMIEVIQLLEESFSDLVATAVKLEEKIEEKTGTTPSEKVGGKLEEVKKETEKKLTTSQSREKLRGLLMELGKSSEYKDFLNNLSQFFQTNWQYLSTLLNETSTDSKTYTSLLVVISDVQVLLERFSGGKSLNTLRLRLGTLMITISRDQKVREFFGKWRDFLKKTFETPENMESMDKELTSLLDCGKDLVKRESIKEDLGVVFKEFKELIQRLVDDDTLKTVGKDIEHIRKELLLNADGKLDLMTLKNTLPTLKNVLIPTITSALKHIPIPTITTDNEKYFLQLSNLSLAAKDLIPEKVRIHFTNDVLFDFSTEGKDLFISRLTVLMRDFNATVRDINFKYDRKKTPQISDFGVADVEAQGIHIDIRWRMDMNSSRLCFYVDHVKCLIESLRTDIKEANHKMLDNIYLSLFSGGMKRNLESTIEETLREKLLEFSIDTTVPLSEQLKLPQA
jgi:hypothetical protein